MITGILQQAKQVQDKIEELQGELSALRIEGQAGGGMVTAVANGQQELISIRIDPQLLKEDVELVEDLVTAAVSQALTKAREAAQEKMKDIAGGALGGLNLPVL
jgi:DNA-binding YbaB/EbfC family protein